MPTEKNWKEQKKESEKFEKVRCGSTILVMAMSKKVENEVFCPAMQMTKPQMNCPLSFNEILEMTKKNKRIKRVVIIADANFGTRGRDDLEVYTREQIGTATPLPNSNPNTIIWLPSEDQIPSPQFSYRSKMVCSPTLLLESLAWMGRWEIDGVRDGNLTF